MGSAPSKASILPALFTQNCPWYRWQSCPHLLHHSPFPRVAQSDQLAVSSWPYFLKTRT